MHLDKRGALLGCHAKTIALRRRDLASQSSYLQGNVTPGSETVGVEPSSQIVERN